MEILIMQVFVSLILVVGSVLLFLFTARQRDFDHADRLALMPIDDAERSGAAEVLERGFGGAAPIKIDDAEWSGAAERSGAAEVLERGFGGAAPIKIDDAELEGGVGGAAPITIDTDDELEGNEES